MNLLAELQELQPDKKTEIVMFRLVFVQNHRFASSYRALFVSDKNPLELIPLKSSF